MSTEATTNNEATLSGRELEMGVGDYLSRLRMASDAKFNGSFVHWGIIGIRPVNDEFVVEDVDGNPIDSINREDREVEQLVAVFDKALSDEVNAL